MILPASFTRAPFIADGALLRLLPQWYLDAGPVMALVPTRKGVSARLRRFIEAARAALEPVSWGGREETGDVRRRAGRLLLADSVEKLEIARAADFRDTSIAAQNPSCSRLWTNV
jgi:hypothetical protein